MATELDHIVSLVLTIMSTRIANISSIFLPLTFISGFFGMNFAEINSDKELPSLKYYFIVAVPLMLIVVLIYLILKQNLNIGPADPIRRGRLDSVYHQFSHDHPQLWSRNGPRDSVNPRGLLSRLKWRFVKSWYAPPRRPAVGGLTNVNSFQRASTNNPANQGPWQRLQYSLARRWLHSLGRSPEADPLSMAERGGTDEEGDWGALTEFVGATTPAAIAEGEPRAAVRVAEAVVRHERLTHDHNLVRQTSSGSSERSGRKAPRSQSPREAASRARSNSPASAMLCEEEYVAPTDNEYTRGRIDEEERRERRGVRDRSVSAGSSRRGFLGIPPASKQVLTRTDP